MASQRAGRRNLSLTLWLLIGEGAESEPPPDGEERLAGGQELRALGVALGRQLADSKSALPSRRQRGPLDAENLPRHLRAPLGPVGGHGGKLAQPSVPLPGFSLVVRQQWITDDS